MPARLKNTQRAPADATAPCRVALCGSQRYSNRYAVTERVQERMCSRRDRYYFDRQHKQCIPHHAQATEDGWSCARLVVVVPSAGAKSTREWRDERFLSSARSAPGGSACFAVVFVASPLCTDQCRQKCKVAAEKGPRSTNQGG